MSRWSERRERFRAYMAGDRCLNPASIHDPMSARVAEYVGYEIGMFAGSTASMTVLGAPDHIVLTLSEFAGQCHRICRAASIPMMVDADHGYGNALNVMRTIEELEFAGISGCSIEDTDLPPPHGMEGKQRLLSIEEGIGKMKAAVAARADNDFFIAGRTSATAIAGVDEAIKRARAYQDCGVDALFFVGVKTRAELDAIAAEVSLPIVLGGTPAELNDLDYLSDKGVRIALQGHHPIRASVQAIYAIMRAMRDGTKPSDLKGMPSKELMRHVLAEDGYDRAMKDFL